MHDAATTKPKRQPPPQTWLSWNGTGISGFRLLAIISRTQSSAEQRRHRPNALTSAAPCYLLPRDGYETRKRVRDATTTITVVRRGSSTCWWLTASSPEGGLVTDRADSWWVCVHCLSVYFLVFFLSTESLACSHALQPRAYILQPLGKAVTGGRLDHYRITYLQFPIHWSAF